MRLFSASSSFRNMWIVFSKDAKREKLIQPMMESK
jgi:hypothetical protein